MASDGTASNTLTRKPVAAPCSHFAGKNEEPHHAFKLKGLSPDAQYALFFEDSSNPAITARGAELMKTGVELNLPERNCSELVFFSGGK